MNAIGKAILYVLTVGIGLWLAFASALFAQPYVISTVAGGSPLPTPVSALNAPLSYVGGIAADAAGNLYFSSSNCVFKVAPNEIMTLVAGNSRKGYSGGGGPATSAQLNTPGGWP